MWAAPSSRGGGRAMGDLNTITSGSHQLGLSLSLNNPLASLAPLKSHEPPAAASPPTESLVVPKKGPAGWTSNPLAMKRANGSQQGGGDSSTVTAEPEQPLRKGTTLSGYIRERFDDFSRSQKDVARYIVDHLEEAAFQTAEELARRADTSSSTVV